MLDRSNSVHCTPVSPTGYSSRPSAAINFPRLTTAMAQLVPSASSKSDAKTSPPPADEAPPPTPKNHTDLISTLPTRTGWAQPLALYQNYWLTPGRLRHTIAVKDHYAPRRDDILLATYPKCGTTWLKALAFAITTRRHASAAAAGGRHPQELVPHLELPALAGDLADVERLPSPRLLATHLPLSLLPPAVTSTSAGCRVVYLCRNPKDAFVSWWFFVNKMLSSSSPSSAVDLDDALGMFCEGFSPLGPFWEHYLEYWRASAARPDKIIFLRYEEIVSDPVQVVTTLAGFFSVPFTEEEERGGVPEEVVRMCSFKTLSGLEENKNGGVAFGNDLVIGKSTFFREGKVGDWENHMTEEQGRKFDEVLEDKFRGSGLVF